MTTRLAQVGPGGEVSYLSSYGLSVLANASMWVSGKSTNIASNLFPDKGMRYFRCNQGVATVGNTLEFYGIRTDNNATPSFVDGFLDFALANGPSVLYAGNGTLQTITACTNASPPVLTVTTAPVSGSIVLIEGIIGAASVLNGPTPYMVTNVSGTTFSLQNPLTGGNIAAPGAYTSGGQAAVGTALTISTISNASPPVVTISSGTMPPTGTIVFIQGVATATGLNNAYYLFVNTGTTTGTLQVLGTGANVGAAGAGTGGTIAPVPTMQPNMTASLVRDQLVYQAAQVIDVTNTGYVLSGSFVFQDMGPYSGVAVYNNTGAAILAFTMSDLPIDDNLT